ncbi:ribosomal protein L4/L1 family protein [Phlyctema vagabunda]|uniref:Large ribosomal subunit protein uL4m n=1 Tax=Phlyctema vagabunda TaxID=108571 RepID=A0ABR4PIW1_9HELO
MASKGLQGFSKRLNTLRGVIAGSKDPLTQCLAPRMSRTMATETSLPSGLVGLNNLPLPTKPSDALPSSVLTTIYKFPTMEPLRFESYPTNQLYLPLRRDILHRAVIFEGDFTRQGTASTKTRWEIHGSHRKIRPQKGTGRARLGTAQSPMLKGGSKSFGPRPRDFATGLPKKMYDLAWRTALSYRYRKGELIICEDGMDIEHPKTRFVKDIFAHNHWGKDDGRTLVITGSFRKNLFRALRHAGEDGKAQMTREVDVKDLLELGRIVIEKRALDEILSEHASDLTSGTVRSVV